jgi:ferrochelatase
VKRGVLLVTHGTVDALEDLPAFLTNIRRGHPPPPELTAEVRRRYEAIGGHSPLNDISRRVASKLEVKLNVPTRVSMRLWKPTPRDVLEDLARLDVDRVAVVPLAQHSASVYADAVRAAAKELEDAGGAKFTLACASNWGRQESVTRAYANEVRRALEAIGSNDRKATRLLFSAHSLPKSIINAGDPYETEVRASAAAILADVRGIAPDARVVFQSQGMSAGPGGRPMEWLGPTLQGAIEDAATDGMNRIVVAPIGFLADHVEILYDLDIEARAWAEARGITLSRTRSLDDCDALIDALAEVARPLLDSLA